MTVTNGNYESAIMQDAADGNRSMPTVGELMNEWIETRFRQWLEQQEVDIMRHVREAVRKQEGEW